MTARKALQTWDDLIYYEKRYVWLQQCPIPCDQTVFEAKISSYHMNSYIVEDVMTVYKIKQILYLEYETFDREKHVETLIYDTATFLTQVGGNLGLFLGISCLSVILTIIDFFRNGKNIFAYC